jgi:uncharacterized protein YdcH (DUF465 family)
MKSKREINKLAKEVARLEKIFDDINSEDKDVQSAMLRIEEIMESLSPAEALALDDAVRKIFGI